MIWITLEGAFHRAHSAAKQWVGRTVVSSAKPGVFV
ncbi:hypothetical protein NK6_8926 [Bradyrhizobium diazoefficiens]|uniref:Uncharacterized protein n=1 Tax=Bradyrhizobium diazoefficiens TaxID=1355477 RepID=A0A0E3VX55_9BRAD|nr:hypothetical protein NK6_8926 [Bradyrhizobium diazoefficiens]